MRQTVFWMLIASVFLFAGNLLPLPIDSSANHIVFPAGNVSFSPFLHKLDSLIYTKQGNVNILHLGGSHIQADVFSNRIRSRLIRDIPLPAASRGFVFPFTAANSNTPISYASRKRGHFKWERSAFKNRKKPLGLMGFQVTTIDPDAEIRIALDTRIPNEKIWSFTKIRLFGFSADSIEPVLQLEENGKRYAGKHDPFSGSFTFEIPRKADSLVFTFPWKNSAAELAIRDTLGKLDSLGREALFADSNFYKNLPTFTLTGIFLSDSLPGLTYNSIGVNGAGLEAYLSLQDLERDLDFSPPDLVIFSIGINDANVENFDSELFKARYDTLIYRIRKVSPKAALLFMSNNDSYFTKTNKPNKNGEKVAQANFELAKKYKGGFWNMYKVMGGFQSIDSWVAADYAKKDRVHFKNSGYELLGDLFFDALREVIFPDSAFLKSMEKKR